MSGHTVLPEAGLPALFCDEFCNLINRTEYTMLSMSSFEHTVSYLYERFFPEHPKREEVFRKLLINYSIKINKQLESRKYVYSERAHDFDFVNHKCYAGECLLFDAQYAKLKPVRVHKLEDPEREIISELPYEEVVKDLQNMGLLIPHVAATESTTQEIEVVEEVAIEAKEVNGAALYMKEMEEEAAFLAEIDRQIEEREAASLLAAMHAAAPIVELDDVADSSSELCNINFATVELVKEFDGQVTPLQESIQDFIEYLEETVEEKCMEECGSLSVSQESVYCSDTAYQTIEEPDCDDFSALQLQFQLFKDQLVEDVILEYDAHQGEREEITAWLFMELPEVDWDELARQETEDLFLVLPLLNAWCEPGKQHPLCLHVDYLAHEDEKFEILLIEKFRELGIIDVEERLVFGTQEEEDCMVHTIHLDGKLLAVEINQNLISFQKIKKRLYRELCTVRRRPTPGVDVLEDIRYPLDIFNITPNCFINDLGRFEARAVCPYGAEWNTTGVSELEAIRRLSHEIVNDFEGCPTMFDFLRMTSEFDSTVIFKDLDNFGVDHVSGFYVGTYCDLKGYISDIQSITAPAYEWDDLFLAKVFQFQRGAMVHRWDLEQYNIIYPQDKLACIERKHPDSEVYFGMVQDLKENPPKLLALARYSQRIDFDLIVCRLRENDYEGVLFCDHMLGEDRPLDEAVNWLLNQLGNDIDIFTGVDMRPKLHISSRAIEELRSEDFHQLPIIGDRMYTYEVSNLNRLCMTVGIDLERLIRKTSSGRIMYLRDYHRNGHYFMTPNPEERPHPRVLVRVLNDQIRRWDESRPAKVGFIPLLVMNICWSWLVMWLLSYIFNFNWN